MDWLKEIYGAQDEAGIVASALDKFVEEQTFDSCYIRFEKNRVYTYDPAMDREATWVFYQTGENEGFISFFTELDANEGNPDPVICPALVYNPNSQVMTIVLNYSEFMVTLEMTR